MTRMYWACATLILMPYTIAVPAAAQERAWIDANVGVAASRENPSRNAVSFPFRDETATATVAYNLPRGAAFDAGGGWMFHPRVGVGIAIAGAAHEDAADVSAVIPDRDLFDAHAMASTRTGIDLRRSERAVHVHAMALVTPPDTPFSVRVFGGPTRFRVTQDVADGIVYLESPVGVAYSIEITDIDILDDVEASGWGFHTGADVGYFFTERVGIGGMIRVTRGEVEIPGLFGDPQEIAVGGIRVGGGLRLRF